MTCLLNNRYIFLNLISNNLQLELDSSPNQSYNTNVHGSETKHRSFKVLWSIFVTTVAVLRQYLFYKCGATSNPLA